MAPFLTSFLTLSQSFGLPYTRFEDRTNPHFRMLDAQLAKAAVDIDHLRWNTEIGRKPQKLGTVHKVRPILETILKILSDGRLVPPGWIEPNSVDRIGA